MDNRLLQGEGEGGRPEDDQKRTRTSALLRFRDSTGPISSLQITGIDSDQRVEAMRRTTTGRSQAPGAASGVNEPPAFTRMVYGVYESLDEAKWALSEISKKLQVNEPLLR
jgi:hypothetical protein